MTVTSRDSWAEWLLERRFGGDDAVARVGLEKLARVRDRILDDASFAAGETLLDVGCGDGLIAFGALERGAGRVVFADVSQELLDTCRSIADDLGVLDRCEFVRTTADDLSPVADASVDVVTTRAVLIYVEDKQRAFDEFHRVLRSGGRVSLFEQINRHATFLTAYDVTPVQEVAARVREVYLRRQPESDPMLNFDEHDLLDFAERAGFERAFVRLELETKPPDPRPWETFVQIVPNPKVPSLGEAMEEALGPEERERLTAHLRPLVEQGRGRLRQAGAYVSATKAGSA